MSQALLRPARSSWLLRTLMGGVARLCSLVAIGGVLLFVFILSLPNRNLLLLPVALVLLPVALVAVVLGCPFWGIGAACGLWLHEKQGVYGSIECEGIRLDALHKAGPDFVAWTAVAKVVRVQYPLSLHYRLQLRDGSVVEVDFLDEEQLALQLEKHGVGFRCARWLQQEALG
jgi:hypothetical protein